MPDFIRREDNDINGHGPVGQKTLHFDLPLQRSLLCRLHDDQVDVAASIGIPLDARSKEYDLVRIVAFDKAPAYVFQVLDHWMIITCVRGRDQFDGGNNRPCLHLPLSVFVRLYLF